MRHFTKSLILLGAFGCGLASCTNVQTAEETATAAVTPEVSEGKMTPLRMGKLIKKIDEEADVRDNVISFKIQERDVIIVFDANNDRMRALTPVAPVSLLDDAIMMRMLQANYDSVLDARYAIADGLIWSAFIHPLGSLDEEELLSAIAQVVTGAETFGTTYTSGAMVFGGGDSNELHNELLKELEKAAKKKDAI